MLSDATVKTRIERWARAGHPVNSEHPHQLLAIIINPGVSTVQGTCMWPEFPGRTVMGKCNAYRIIPMDWTDKGYSSFNGALEIFSTDEKMIKNKKKSSKHQTNKSYQDC